MSACTQQQEIDSNSRQDYCRGTTCKIKLICFAFWEPRTSLLAHRCCEGSYSNGHLDVPTQIAFSDWGLCSRQAFSDCPAWSHVGEEATTYRVHQQQSVQQLSVLRLRCLCLCAAGTHGSHRSSCRPWPAARHPSHSQPPPALAPTQSHRLRSQRRQTTGPRLRGVP